MTTPFRTDVTVRGSLNAGLLPSAGRGKPGSGASSGSGGRGGAGAEAEPTSEAYLDRFAEDLNRKIDNDIEVLVDGLEQCVELSKVGSKDKFKAAQDALEVELKAESMVRATESLLSLSHTLKLLFLLNKEDQGSANVEDAQREQASRELQEAKDEVKTVLEQIMANR